jgi:hypothetical protein
MTDVVKSAILFALLAGLAMSAAAAPVYKWVDEKGVVNYSTELPPAGSRSKLVASANSNTRIYDPIQASLDASAQQRRNADFVRNENEDRLQRELDELRYRLQLSADSAEAARKRRLEECQRQRRVDCDSRYDDYAYPPLYVVARYPRPLIGFVPVAFHPPRVPRPPAAGLR